MERNKAIEMLCINEMKCLSEKNREDILVDWWGIDSSDALYDELEDELKKELNLYDGPPADGNGLEKYDPLILISLKHQFDGVTNKFLERNLKIVFDKYYKVCGEIDELHSCPCCNYKTLHTRYDYEVCKLCGWEDDGTEKLTQYSAANHITLENAKTQFEKLIINKENEEKYLKEKIKTL